MVDFKTSPTSYPIKFLGKKWSIEILFHLIHGRKRFSDFLELYTDLSSKVLSERLKELYSFELIDKIVVNMIPLKVKYRITDKGRKLGPVFYELAKYSIENFKSDLFENDTLNESELKEWLENLF